MGLLTRPVRTTRTLVLTISVAVAIVVGVAGWWLGIGPAGDETDGVQSVTETQIDTKYPLVTGDSSIYRLPLPALIQESDVVIIATVDGRSEQWRRPAGGVGLTSLGFDYHLSVEGYLKGDGATSLTLPRPFAMEVADRNITHLFDSPNPIAIGGRYFFFLRGPEKDTMLTTAEPFRFRIEDGVARAESTLGVGHLDGEGNYVVDSGHSFESPFFPAKSELDFTRDVLTLVATAAN